MSFKGYRHSDEQKKKWSNSRKGKGNPFYGKEHSVDTKNKISNANRGKLRGKQSNNWKGGRVKIAGGYIALYKPDHPYSSKNGYILEHRYVMEQRIGRYLKKEERVHHINGILDDNRIENLLLFPSPGSHHNVHRDAFTGRFVKARL